MKSKTLNRSILLCATFCLLTAVLWAQSDDRGAKQDMKDAVHSTAQAAKKTGRKIKHGTQKVVHKSAQATQRTAKKAKDKTQ